MNAQHQAAPRLDFTYIPPEPTEEQKPSETEQLAKSLVTGFEKIGEKLDKMAEDPTPQPNYSAAFPARQDRQQDRQPEPKRPAPDEDDISKYAGIALSRRVDPSTGEEQPYVPMETIRKVVDREVAARLQGQPVGNDPVIEQIKYERQMQAFQDGIRSLDSVYQTEGGDKLVGQTIDYFFSPRNPYQNEAQADARLAWAVEQTKQMALPSGNPTIQEVAARSANQVGQTAAMSSSVEPRFPKGATIVIDRVAAGEADGNFDEFQDSIAFEHMLEHENATNNLGWKITTLHPREDSPKGVYRVSRETVRNFVRS